MNPEFPPGELVIATVAAPFKAADDEVTRWVYTGEALAKNAFKTGFSKVHFFASLEIDNRGLDIYHDLTHRMEQIAEAENVTQDVWTFSIDDDTSQIDHRNRLIRICTGRNLTHEFAMRNPNVSHVLFLDSDMRPDGDCISKLIEVDANIVGGEVPVYCLKGPRVGGYDFPVQDHWNTAGFLLVRRNVINRIRWRADIYDHGQSDDPCFHKDAIEAGFGRTLVRKDVKGIHSSLLQLEQRGHDLKVYK